MTTCVILSSLLALLILFLRQQKLTGYQTIGEHSHGWLRCELRRRNGLVLMEADGFPRPVEERVLAWWLGGLLLWTQHRSIGLPLETDRRIDHIASEEFDVHFSPRFRMVGAMRHSDHRFASQ